MVCQWPPDVVTRTAAEPAERDRCVHVLRGERRGVGDGCGRTGWTMEERAGLNERLAAASPDCWVMIKQLAEALMSADADAARGVPVPATGNARSSG
jgi:hypothetical protein